MEDIYIFSCPFALYLPNNAPFSIKSNLVPKILRIPFELGCSYCAAYQRSAICDEFGESDGCSLLIG